MLSFNDSRIDLCFSTITLKHLEKWPVFSRTLASDRKLGTIKYLLCFSEVDVVYDHSLGLTH